MKIYIPENFDFDAFETFSHAETLIKGYKRDKAAYILHLLSYIPMIDSRYQQVGQLVPLYSKILQARIGNYYLHYLNCLGAAGIIETDNHYIPREKSRWYRLSHVFSLALKEYTISDYSFKRNLEDFYKEQSRKEVYKYPNLIQWFNEKLEIDSEACFNFIFKDYLIKKEHPHLRSRDEQGYKDPQVQYKCASLCIHRFIDQDFIGFIVDPSGFRFHSLLTSARKVLRNAITYEGKQIQSLDIKNSQPYFSILLFRPEFWLKEEKNKRYKKLFNQIYKNNNIYNSSIMFTTIEQMLCQPDVQRYMDLVKEGKLYEFFIEQFQKRFNICYDRDAIKRELFSVLFSKNSTGNKGKKLFKELFPAVDGLFRIIKTGKNNALALLLQRIESDVILEDICKQISKEYPHIPLFTIHDSIATTSDHLDLVQTILLERCIARIGVPPKVQREAWCLENLQKELTLLESKITPNEEAKHDLAA
jgi:hypothetical protein